MPRFGISAKELSSALMPRLGISANELSFDVNGSGFPPKSSALMPTARDFRQRAQPTARDFRRHADPRKGLCVHKGLTYPAQWQGLIPCPN
jgi:hypothetical protein